MKKVLLIVVVLILASVSALLLRDKFLAEPETYSGRLEADTVKVSAQTSGKVDLVAFQEGSKVRQDQLLAIINSDRITAQKQQLTAQLKYNQDLLKKNQRLVKKGAVPKQKISDLKTTISVLNAQIKNLDLQLRDAVIRAPLSGTVLNKFINRGEIAAPGSAIAEIADLSSLDAIIYLPVKKLARISLGTKVPAQIEGIANSVTGSVYWVSSEAEFTPKTILTKETRTTLVYAVKVRVPNGGKLKIGLPVDVVLP